MSIKRDVRGDAYEFVGSCQARASPPGPVHCAMPFCTSCGKECFSKFCGNCGKPMGAVAASEIRALTI